MAVNLFLGDIEPARDVSVTSRSSGASGRRMSSHSARSGSLGISRYRQTPICRHPPPKAAGAFNSMRGRPQMAQQSWPYAHRPRVLFFPIFLGSCRAAEIHVSERADDSRVAIGRRDLAPAHPGSFNRMQNWDWIAR
jgi:hypothetical protein